MTADIKNTDVKASQSQTMETEKAGKDYVEFKHTFPDPWLEKEVTVAFRFRRPSQPQAARAQKAMMKKPDGALQALCLDVIHADDREDFVLQLKTYPGLSSTFGGELLKSTGFGDLGN